MANLEHLDILRQGVEAWNVWRHVNPTIAPDLSEAYLDGTNLRGADLRGADLSKANLGGAYLGGANLRGADLSNTYLDQADLREANLNLANLSEVDLREANLNLANLSEVDLSKANLRGAGLSKANLRGAYLSEADLSEADLSEADLSEADLSWADLSEAHLSEADLRGADLRGADLRGADLSRADLREAHLSRADLSGTHLSGADLREAHLYEAMIGSTIFANADLSAVQGLEAVHHSGPSTIGIDTLYRSGGKIPEAFLRGCGVPDSFIDYIPSLIGAMQPIQFYSCFISYSTKDEDFARRLHQQMRAEHLLVWFAPEDIKGGQKLHEQLERAIQLHDRLLLVLSEHSIHSEWVTTEIYNARQVEQREQRRKLFPIRLTSMDTLKAWKCFDADTGKDLAREVREYFIPDFSNWKEHDAFETAFARLLRDLKATEVPLAP